MKKEKRIIFRPILIWLIFFILFLSSLASAKWTILDRWGMGEGLQGIEAKIIFSVIVLTILIIIFVSLRFNTFLSVLLSIIITFLFTSYVNPEFLTGIFKSYDGVSLAIATILAIIIPFALSIFAAYKGGRGLAALQLISWGVIFLIYFSELIIQIGWQWGLWRTYILQTAGMSMTQYQGWWTSTIIIVIVSGLMTLLNGFFLNLAIKWLMGVRGSLSQAATATNIGRMKTAMKGLKQLGKEMESENP